MNVLEAIESRRSIRRFTQQPIDGEILDKIIEVSRLYAPARNVQASATAWNLTRR